MICRILAEGKGDSVLRANNLVIFYEKFTKPLQQQKNYCTEAKKTLIIKLRMFRYAGKN